MTTETVVEKVTDGAITAITLKIHSGSDVLQETQIELSPYEEQAIIKSNKLLVDDEAMIADCLNLVKRELLKHGVRKIVVSEAEHR